MTTSTALPSASPDRVGLPRVVAPDSLEAGKGRQSSTRALKGLRHTVATTLREMGKDYATIADILGQKTEAMAKHYSRRADTSRR